MIYHMNYNIMQMKRAARDIERKSLILKHTPYKGNEVTHEVLNAEINELSQEILRRSHD